MFTVPSTIRDTEGLDGVSIAKPGNAFEIYNRMRFEYIHHLAQAGAVSMTRYAFQKAACGPALRPLRPRVPTINNRTNPCTCRTSTPFKLMSTLCLQTRLRLPLVVRRFPIQR